MLKATGYRVVRLGCTRRGNLSMQQCPTHAGRIVGAKQNAMHREKHQMRLGREGRSGVPHNDMLAIA
eukprot:1145748-Pelagomonas_calceolata.AAC.5